jgi:HEAT repeat protein
MKHSLLVLALGATAVLTAREAPAQSLADRIGSAPRARVQFSYAARAEACGNGRTFLQVANNTWYGSYSDGDRRDACVNGPVRVLLDRADRQIVSVSTFVGPLAETPADVTDLGRVPTRAAADFLLSLADTADGRVSRDAILPAAIADSVDVNARLLTIARNQNAARETRRSAISWLGRPLDLRGAGVRDVATALLGIAKDDDDNQSVRQQALRTLARLEHGGGTAQLMELARDANRPWLAREALSALNSSGDPRARQYLREVVRAASLPDEILSAAVRGVGGEYATGDDVKLLRDAYAKLPGDKSRESAISAIANFGGSTNVQWLLALARDADQPIGTRRRAMQHAYRSGAPPADVVKIYDETTDPQLREVIISALAESGDKAATDKLMAIARSDESSQMRRRAINALGRSSDERVKKFLQDLAAR